MPAAHDLARTEESTAPWKPRIGDTVRDTALKRIGRVMDRFGSRYYLRPLNGGCEWDAHPDDLRPATASDVLAPAVAEANQRSSKGEPA
ncbi:MULTISPECIES: H/ACA ribonucleoprotein complex subunit GAR1/NAF1 [Streptomyces]|uniref:hypothetical protein n=1 Tax=Streptomyces TaxID=1883 RepID=UPI00025CDEE2|nr:MULTISPECIES: hypothetical protein [Streptomyces]AZK94463.1 hypothetical protein B7R87_11790 [Streptomyces tsukubensis]EIF90221.1 hypothetical protein [Streptomyces tsukubensis NRRL18488]